jgi:hypothetical protein
MLRVKHLDLSRHFLEAHAGALFSIDLVLVAVMARSYSLVEGFTSAFDGWNPVVAAPLLRMQIDSLVRLAYIATNPQSDEVARYVINGGELRALKDADGKNLTDRRLLEHAEVAHPWIASVYKATSGWVHFSPAHLWAAWQLDTSEAADEAGVNIFGAVPIRPEQIPLTALQELLESMIRTTEELFGYIQSVGAAEGPTAGRGARGTQGLT